MASSAVVVKRQHDVIELKMIADDSTYWYHVSRIMYITPEI